MTETRQLNNTSPWPFVSIICLAVLFSALDQTVVVTVLPQVMADLEVPVTQLDQASWIITGFLIGYTVAIPLVARMADAYGHMLLFIAALAVFALGSTLAALAPSLESLVAARVLQALGGGAMVPVGMAMVAARLPHKNTALAVGLVGGSAEAGIVLGPLYGGAITDALDWRWVFWLNIPQSALILVPLLVLAAKPLPGRRGEVASPFLSANPPSTRVDYLGGLLLTASLTLITIALSQQSLFDLDSPLPYILLAAGLTLAALLALHQRRSASPLIPLELLRSRPALASIITKLLVGAALIIAMVTIPLMANTIQAMSPLDGGLRLIRLTAAIPLGAVVGGFLASRLGPRPITIAGLVAASVGLFLMSGWTTTANDPADSLHLILAGLGFGLVIAPLFTTAMESGPRDYQATAASLVTVSRMMGMALGLAALSAWGMGHFQSLTAGLHLPLPALGESSADYQTRLDAYQSGLTTAGVDLFQAFFRAAAALMLAGIVPALWLGKRQHEIKIPSFLETHGAN
ncbi:MAG: MFS transporter [SAR202 cluster bacterium]|nr:MFS transporter [SAR202 cluster bacterium]